MTVNTLYSFPQAASLRSTSSLRMIFQPVLLAGIAANTRSWRIDYWQRYLFITFMGFSTILAQPPRIVAHALGTHFDSRFGAAFITGDDGLAISGDNLNLSFVAPR